jgi:hypothetical protein
MNALDRGIEAITEWGAAYEKTEIQESAAAELAQLRASLNEAIELAEETVGYASEYFQKKWGLLDRLSELKEKAHPK